MNRIFTLMRAPANVSTLYLSPEWSAWYRRFFDSAPEWIRLAGNEPDPPLNCTVLHSAKLFHGTYRVDREVQTHRALQLAIHLKGHDEADRTFANIARPQLRASEAGTRSSIARRRVVTVHRRNLEGSCMSRGKRACPQNVSVAQETCLYDRNMIDRKLQELRLDEGAVVILCTDGQAGKLDRTFDTRSNGSMLDDLHLMMRSDVHFGPPQSSIDALLSLLRIGVGQLMLPSRSGCIPWWRR